MLAHRIKTMDSLTWGDLCKSLRHVTVGRSDVADEIEAGIFSTGIAEPLQQKCVSIWHSFVCDI